MGRCIGCVESYMVSVNLEGFDFRNPFSPWEVSRLVPGPGMSIMVLSNWDFLPLVGYNPNLLTIVTNFLGHPSIRSLGQSVCPSHITPC